MAVNRRHGPRARNRTALREVQDHSVHQDAASTRRSLPQPRAFTGALRRALDIVGALVLLLLCAPLLVATCAAILVASGRPVLFGHARLGRNGVVFRCWKLRTMHEGAEAELGRSHDLRTRYVANGYKLALVDDPRVTGIGRVLRRTYVDELPQLFNVLTGSMSLVGPRPIVPDELREYGAHKHLLLSERPGIVGAWTSLGAARPGYPQRSHIELEYIRTRSIPGDIAILLRSFAVVLRGHREDG